MVPGRRQRHHRRLRNRPVSAPVARALGAAREAGVREYPRHRRAADFLRRLLHLPALAAQPRLADEAVLVRPCHMPSVRYVSSASTVAKPGGGAVLCRGQQVQRPPSFRVTQMVTAHPPVAAPSSDRYCWTRGPPPAAAPSPRPSKCRQVPHRPNAVPHGRLLRGPWLLQCRPAAARAVAAPRTAHCVRR